MHDVFRDLLKPNSSHRLPGLPKLLSEGGTSSSEGTHFQSRKAGLTSIHRVNNVSRTMTSEDVTPEAIRLIYSFTLIQRG